MGLLGMLLYKKNNNNQNYQNYMQENAYNIGRLLAWADRLHILYCQKVRKSKTSNEDDKTDKKDKMKNEKSYLPNSLMVMLC